MINLFQRIIQNDFQWTRPSRGRLGPSGEGDYVKETGFGHEDWNFNKNLLIDNFLYGYCYYKPAENKRLEKFNIAFATYTNRQWFLAGFYLNCEFVDNPPFADEILEQKMQDLQLMGTSLGDSWRNLSSDKFLEKLRHEAQYLKWRVSPENVIRASRPIAINKNIFVTKNFHITNPTQIDEVVFNSLYTLVQNEIAFDDHGYDSEFPEGKEMEVKHKSRERNQALIKSAKDLFKKNNYGKLFCQICRFDFEDIYGEIGRDFIEGHHTLPISELVGEVKTKVTDVAIVCSNCHRMLHRKRPWLVMEELKKLVNERNNS